MEIRQLRYFISAATHLNFTRAARECFIVQTAMTQQIANLESEIGVRLFERGYRSLTLTPAGEEMVPLLFRATDEYHDWLLRGFSPAERRQLALFLERLRQNVQEQPLPDDPYPAG